MYFILVFHHDWTPLAELVPGDLVDTDTGPQPIASIRTLNHVSDVFNIEVHGHHVYRVTKDAILVHNACPDVPDAPDGAPGWRQYEQRHGGQQTTMRTQFEGREITVRLDNPPEGARIVDFKDYDWTKSAYDGEFIQGRVIEDFQTQIRKYQTIAPDVHLQFSLDPPAWVIHAIEEVGGTFSVIP